MTNSVYVVKNGLSALLMRAIWEASGERWFYFHFDEDQDHSADVWRILNSLGHAARQVDTEFRSPIARHLLANGVGKVFHTHSGGPITRKFIHRVLAHARESYVVQHGTVELINYIRIQNGRLKSDASGFYLLSGDNVAKYLQGKDLSPPIFRYPLIAVPPVDLLPRADVRRSLFAAHRMLETGVIEAAELSLAIDAFLDRRQPVHYVIKDHPRGCPKTIELLVSHFNRRGLTFEIAGGVGMIECDLPKTACSEVTSFYSSAVPISAELHGVEVDWMVPELNRSKIGSRTHKGMVKILRGVFGKNISRSMAYKKISVV